MFELFVCLSGTFVFHHWTQGLSRRIAMKICIVQISLFASNVSPFCAPTQTHTLTWIHFSIVWTSVFRGLFKKQAFLGRCFYSQGRMGLLAGLWRPSLLWTAVTNSLHFSNGFGSFQSFWWETALTLVAFLHISDFCWYYIWNFIMLIFAFWSDDTAVIFPRIICHFLLSSCPRTY